jgi:hypothetical protein
MGQLVIERVELQKRGSHEQALVRASGGLSLREGKYEILPDLFACVFAGGPAPDLASAVVDFVLNGAAHQWRGDFLLGTWELMNRSNGRRHVGQDEIKALFDRELGANLEVRLASFATPPVSVPDASGAADVPTGDPPPALELSQHLARYEAALERATSSHETAAALYGDLFPLLEAQEAASLKMHHRIRQLELHQEAEEVLAEFKALEHRVQERIDAGRKASGLEKQVVAWDKEKEGMVRIDERAIEHARELEADVEQIRGRLIEAEKQRKAAEAQTQAIHSRAWWILGAIGLLVLAGSWLVRGYLLPFFYYGIPAAYIGMGAGAFLMSGIAMGVFQSSRRAARRREYKRCQTTVQSARRELELAELALLGHLRPFGRSSSAELASRAAVVTEWWSVYDAACDELQRLRQYSGTDDTLAEQNHVESARLAELEQRCRELAHYRLSEADRHTVETMIQDLESEARYQKEAATVLQKQCEELSEGWADLPHAVEQVAELRMRLAEWQRWERAFRRMREVIDQLPELPEQGGSPQERAAAYLEQITAGRWTELRIDSESGDFRLHDRDAGLWIRADRENPAVRSTVHLAYRLALLEQANSPVHLPIWLEEPFAELPDGMAEATAKLLADVARQRQVVLFCRERPAIQWPEGTLQES